VIETSSCARNSEKLFKEPWIAINGQSAEESNMQVKEIMRKDPQCCTPETTLAEVAKMMKECDCGAIPVVSDSRTKKPVGIITDRDITIRAVTENRKPAQTKVGDCMTGSIITISPEASLKECARIMEKNQLRRLVVVDRSGQCRGIVVQAQLVKNAPKEMAGELLKEISEPTSELAHNRA
jgi:CBS domain-containing protein